MKKIYDLEVYPNFFLAIVYDIDSNTYISYHLGKKFLDEIILNPDITLIGWNNHGYDDVILKHIQNQALPARSGFFKGTQQLVTEQSIYELSNEIINIGWDSPKIRDLRWQDTVFDSLDVKSVLDPMPSLKKTEIRMGYKQVEDLPYEPGTILTEEQKAVVQEYCYNDVGATFEVYENHAKPHIQLRRFLASRFKLSENKLRSMSEAKTAEHILSSIACKKTGAKTWEIRERLEKEPVFEIELKRCIPNWITFKTQPLQSLLAELKHTTLPINPASGYADGKLIKQVVTIVAKDYQLGIGGLHSVDEPYQWRHNENNKLLEADVTSYYPSILLRDSLFPRGYSSIWIDTYRHIYDARIKAKTNGNTIEANALKIVLNATFGKLGSIWSTFYDPQLLIRVTLTGQLALLMLIEALEESGIEVISANTDGILINRFNNDSLKFETICNNWSIETGMNLEYDEFVQYARRDVNNYTALTQSGKIKNKGIFTPPDLKHDVQAPIIQKMARAKLIYNEEPDDYLEDNKDDFTIYDFLFSFTGFKGWHIQLNKKTKSKSNRWYVSAKPLNNILTKTGGKLGNTIKIPNGENIVIRNEIQSLTLPKDLNYGYYLAAANKLIMSCEK